MARTPKEKLRPLTPEERSVLEDTARARSERAERVARAKALLAVADGATFAAAAQAAGRRSNDGVARLVARFNREGLAAVAGLHGGGGGGHGPAGNRKKGAIEQAYTVAEREGLPVWNQDETGPYQAIPQPGASWQPEGEPERQPHEYLRGGTAKLLTLFHPATGEVRAKGVTQATHAGVHPWLKQEVSEILAALPPVLDPEAPLRPWETWGWDAARRLEWELIEPLPAIRMILIWDHLKGHTNRELVRWLVGQGVLPLYTPIGGSWLNLAESIQRIVVRRALAGQHPQSAAEVIEWLEAAVAGWNRNPTPFEWGGKRRRRRERARERRHQLGGSGGFTRRPIRRSRLDQALANTHVHSK